MYDQAGTEQFVLPIEVSSPLVAVAMDSSDGTRALMLK